MARGDADLSRIARAGAAEPRNPPIARPMPTAIAAAHLAPRGASTTGGTMTLTRRLDITLSFG